MAVFSFSEYVDISTLVINSIFNSKVNEVVQVIDKACLKRIETHIDSVVQFLAKDNSGRSMSSFMLVLMTKA